MKRTVIMMGCVGLILTAIGGCSGSTLPDLAEQALIQSPTFELFSLDPRTKLTKTNDDTADRPELRGWWILGQTAVDDGQVRHRLLSAFRSGVAENTGSVANCFNPRHGIRVKQDGKVHEFIICFECYQVYWYIDGQRQPEILITRSPQPVFDQVLTEAGIKIAK